jgi:hypothetical protein
MVQRHPGSVRSRLKSTGVMLIDEGFGFSEGPTRKQSIPGCVKGAGKHFSRVQGEGQCRIDQRPD